MHKKVSAGQQREVKVDIAAVNAVPSEEFLGWIWRAGYISYVDWRARDALTQRTVHELCLLVYDFRECSFCRLGGLSVRTNLEGHHHGKKTIAVSDYKHGMKSEGRQRRIQQLLHEMAESVVLLCRRCHLDVHSGQHASSTSSCNGV